VATIHQKFTGDAAQLEKEIEKLRKDYIKLQEQMGKAAKDSKGFAGMTIAAAKSQASLRQQGRSPKKPASSSKMFSLLKELFLAVRLEIAI